MTDITEEVWDKLRIGDIVREGSYEGVIAGKGMIDSAHKEAISVMYDTKSGHTFHDGKDYGQLSSTIDRKIYEGGFWNYTQMDAMKLLKLVKKSSGIEFMCDDLPSLSQD